MTTPKMCALIAALVAIAGYNIGTGHAQGSPPVVVLAAGSLRNAMDETMARWRDATGQNAAASYAHAPALAKQIESGAPADIFISADNDWFDYLAQRGLVDVRTRINVAGNGLVLIAAAADKAELKLERGANLAGLVGNDRIAVCTVDSCPGGKYAKAALARLELWESVHSKLIDHETVRVALAAVARRDVRFAIVYTTDAAVEPNVRIVDTFPEHSHPPIVYPGAMVTSSKNPAARAFLEFLQSADATAIFVRHGFRRFEMRERK